MLLRQAQIAAPKDLAWFLASYAREARARAEERDLPNWVSTRKALEEALGMSFSGEKGEHFFRPPSSRPCSTASSPPGSSGPSITNTPT